MTHSITRNVEKAQQQLYFKARTLEALEESANYPIKSIEINFDDSQEAYFIFVIIPIDVLEDNSNIDKKEIFRQRLF